VRRQLLVKEIRVHTAMCGGVVLQKLFTKKHPLTSRCVRCPKTSGSITMPNPLFSGLALAYRGEHINCSSDTLSHFSPLATSKGQKAKVPDDNPMEWKRGADFQNKSLFCFHPFHPHQLQRRRQKPVHSDPCPPLRSPK